LQTISDIQQAIEKGSASVTEIVQQSLKQCEAHNHLNAFISIQAESALKRAQELEKLPADKRGPLFGVPIAVKDNINVEGLPTTCGSRMLEKFESPYNATVTSRLLEAGAVIIGKTNMDEFAMGSSSESSYFGSTLNPQNSAYVPGGSSGGSAAAVAGGCVPVALGSDTGGSIRQPASCCGIVGMKPTYGRVSRFGLVAYASSLDQIGPFAHTVTDAARLLQAIAGHDPKDCTSSSQPVGNYLSSIDTGIKGLKIGIPAEYFGDGLNPAHKTVLDDALQRMAQAGAQLIPVHLPHLQYAISCYYILAMAEASSNLSRFDGVRYTYRSVKGASLTEMFEHTRAEAFGTEVKRRIMLGTFVLSSGYYDAYYVKAQKVRRLIANDFAKAFTQCDVLAAPTLPGNPLRNGEGPKDPLSMYLSDIYTVSLNLAGLPGISVPVGVCEGMKTGLQIFGRQFDEATVLRAARGAERIACC
jgi:aspartyl-tRNA(Asn)/glutamyl-tRNA(Gln) amidotransferase subunit A